MNRMLLKDNRYRSMTDPTRLSKMLTVSGSRFVDVRGFIVVEEPDPESVSVSVRNLLGAFLAKDSLNCFAS